MLEIQGISKTFNPDTPNEVRSLRGVNLELAAGSWVDHHRDQRLGQIHAAECCRWNVSGG